MSNIKRTLLETRRFTVVEEIVTRRDGQTASLQFVKHPGSVAILPMVDDDHVCLIHSRRLTVGKTLIEIPAGTREPNESPLETARRRPSSTS
jgi:ADP-ribose pyrophosphatase